MHGAVAAGRSQLGLLLRLSAPSRSTLNKPWWIAAWWRVHVRTMFSSVFAPPRERQTMW